MVTDNVNPRNVHDNFGLCDSAQILRLFGPYPSGVSFQCPQDVWTLAVLFRCVRSLPVFRADEWEWCLHYIVIT